MKLDPIQTFIEVVRANGFSAAAERTGMPRSTVSLQVRSLEASLGIRLLKRSTRAIALTDEGHRLYRQASGALDELSRAVDDVRDRPGTLRGPIRLTAPADFPTDPLALAVTEFSRLHPEVRFEIMLTNGTLDLVRDNIDIAVRVGGSEAMEAVERRLLDIDWEFCASGAWVDRHGRPDMLQAVSSFISPAPALRAYLERGVLGGAMLPPGIIVVDSHLMARDLVLRGFGIGLLPAGLCAEAIGCGEVQTLLHDAIRARTRLNLIFPTRADMLPRVKAFADHLATLFAPSGGTP